MRLNSELTYSKILAYLIFISGWIGSFVWDNPEILIQGFQYAGIVMAIKAGASEWRKYKNNDNAQIQ